MIQVVEVTTKLAAAKADGRSLVKRFAAITDAEASEIWQTRIFFLDGIEGDTALESVIEELFVIRCLKMR